MENSRTACVTILAAMLLLVSTAPARGQNQDVRHAGASTSHPQAETYLSFGYGTSYGGFGICAEHRGTSRFAGHAGIGYFPAKSITGKEFAKNVVLGEAGVRIYLSGERKSSRLYFDAQFGAVGVAAKRVEFYDPFGGGFYFEEKQQILLGPSALIGLKFVFNPEEQKNSLFFDVAFGVTVLTNNPEWSPISSDVVPTLDLGLGLTI